MSTEHPTPIEHEPGHKSGTGLWATPGFPQRGWVAEPDVEDLGEPCFLCEACQTAICRYVHTLHHMDWPEPIRTGCVCASWLELDKAAAAKREKRAKNAASKQRRHITKARQALTRFNERSPVILENVWLRRGTWNVTVKGNYSLKFGPHQAVIMPASPGWRAMVRTDDGPPQWSQRTYVTWEDVVRAVWRLIERRERHRLLEAYRVALQATSYAHMVDG